MNWMINGERKYVQPEACQPYVRPGATPPVSIWDIIDRLNSEQLKQLVMGYSVHAPRYFETQLLEIA